MSYFVFGLADLEAGATGARDHAHIRSTMEGCATAAGLFVSVEREREPTILAEMRGDFDAEAAVPFLCLKKPADDTSDALISPYDVGIEGAARGAAAIADWVRGVLRDGGCNAVRLWLTEGWDDAFERWKCHPDRLAPLLERRLREENDIPSMQITVSPRFEEALTPR